MKNIIFFLLLFISTASFCQNTDEDQLKLKKYKELFDSGLITEAEYTKLKSDVLFPESKPKKPSVTSVQELNLKQTYLAQITSGSVFMAGGFGAIVGGALVRRNRIPSVVNSKGQINSNFETEYKAYRRQYIILFSAGGLGIGIGVALEALGINNKIKYNKEQTVGITISDNNLGLALKF